MKTLPGSKTIDILRMGREGMATLAIARSVGCTRNYVYRLLHKHGIRASRTLVTMRIPRVAENDVAWLRQEAKRAGASYSDIARALLVDAIEEARNGKR